MSTPRPQTLSKAQKSKKEEENCFQWLEDLRVLFIEGEDEQRATIPLNAPTKPHGKGKEKELQSLREKIKSLGLQLKGLDSKSISDICKGEADKITFALYGKEDELLKFTKKKQTFVKSVYNEWRDKVDFTVDKALRNAKRIGGMSLGFLGSVSTLLGFTSLGIGNQAVGLVTVFVGFAILITNVPQMPKRYKDQILKDLKQELSNVTKIENMDVNLIMTEDTYEFRVIVQRKSLLGEKVGALARPTQRTTEGLITLKF